MENVNNNPGFIKRQKEKALKAALRIEKVAAIQKQYYELHKEEILPRTKEYLHKKREAEPWYFKHSNARSRAKSWDALPDWEIERAEKEGVMELFKACHAKGKDYVVGPIKAYRDGGLFILSNLEIKKKMGI